MKQKIKFSIFTIVVTTLVLILFLVGVIALIGEEEKLIVFCIIMAPVTIAGLYYCPKSIEANDSSVRLHRLLSSPKVFPYSAIQEVDTCYPSAGGIRICGSGGFLGYWGYFSDIMIGTYFGYYGNRSNCILVKLKDGKQYVLGCDNPVALVDYIKTKMNAAPEPFISCV